MTPSLNRDRDLSPPRRRLVDLVRRIEFGTIDGLPVRRGDPVLDPAPVITRDVKLGPSDQSRPPAAPAGSTLKAHFADLFREFDRLGDGVVTRIEVKHSLPFRVLIAERAP
jgi:hypothetical protein